MEGCLPAAFRLLPAEVLCFMRFQLLLTVAIELCMQLVSSLTEDTSTQTAFDCYDGGRKPFFPLQRVEKR